MKIKQLWQSILLFTSFTIICGILYPLSITAVSKTFFSSQANGSIVKMNDQKYAVDLMGQHFTSDAYLWGRFDVVDTKTFSLDNQPVAYAFPENISPSSPSYQNIINARIQYIQSHHPEMLNTPIPIDLITSSGSGLDPHISVNAANYQIKRIAKARNIDESIIESIIKECTNHPLLDVFGEDTVNVLLVNLKLDELVK